MTHPVEDVSFEVVGGNSIIPPETRGAVDEDAPRVADVREHKPLPVILSRLGSHRPAHGFKNLNQDFGRKSSQVPTDVISALNVSP